MPGFELLEVRAWSGDGKTRAFARVKLGRASITGVKLIDGKNSAFIAALAPKDRHGNCRPLASFQPTLEAELLAPVPGALSDSAR